MHRSKILIVEDDLIAAAYLKKICKENGLTVSHATDNADEALQIARDEKPDLILMDIMIKGPLSGCEVAMQIRSINKEVIIIFISAYSSQEMVEYAIESKAYSYLLKPYRDVEIITTIKMALKEIKSIGVKSHIISCKNGFSFNINTNKVYQYEQEIFLSQKLFLLIKLFMQNRGKVVSHEQIVYELWGEEKNINTLRAVIYRLKSKLPELELHTANKLEYVLY